MVGAPAGVLEDYAALAEAFLLLHQATGSLHWLSRAEQLLGIVLDHFADGEGGFFDTADDAEALVVRPAEMTDGATPSGMSLACEALLTYAALTGSSRHREAAEAGLNRLSTVMARAPRFAGWALAVAEAALAGPYQVAVAGDPDGTSELRRAAWAAGSSRARWWFLASRTRRECRCWLTGRSSGASRPPTRAGVLSATFRSPSRVRCARAALAGEPAGALSAGQSPTFGAERGTKSRTRRRKSATSRCR